MVRDMTISAGSCRISDAVGYLDHQLDPIDHITMRLRETAKISV